MTAIANSGTPRPPRLPKHSPGRFHFNAPLPTQKLQTVCAAALSRLFEALRSTGDGRWPPFGCPLHTNTKIPATRSSWPDIFIHRGPIAWLDPCESTKHTATQPKIPQVVIELTFLLSARMCAFHFACAAFVRRSIPRHSSLDFRHGP